MLVRGACCMSKICLIKVNNLFNFYLFFTVYFYSAKSFVDSQRLWQSFLICSTFERTCNLSISSTTPDGIAPQSRI